MPARSLQRPRRRVNYALRDLLSRPERWRGPVTSFARRCLLPRTSTHRRRVPCLRPCTPHAGVDRHRSRYVLEGLALPLSRRDTITRLADTDVTPARVKIATAWSARCWDRPARSGHARWSLTERVGKNPIAGPGSRGRGRSQHSHPVTSRPVPALTPRLAPHQRRSPSINVTLPTPCARSTTGPARPCSASVAAASVDRRPPPPRCAPEQP